MIEPYMIFINGVFSCIVTNVTALERKAFVNRMHTVTAVRRFEMLTFRSGRLIYHLKYQPSKV